MKLNSKSQMQFCWVKETRFKATHYMTQVIWHSEKGRNRDRTQIGDCHRQLRTKVGIENKEEKGSFGGIVLSVNLLGTYTGTYGASLVA